MPNEAVSLSEEGGGGSENHGGVEQFYNDSPAKSTQINSTRILSYPSFVACIIQIGIRDVINRF